MRPLCKSSDGFSLILNVVPPKLLSLYLCVYQSDSCFNVLNISFKTSLLPKLTLNYSFKVFLPSIPGESTGKRYLNLMQLDVFDPMAPHYL